MQGGRELFRFRFLEPTTTTSIADRNDDETILGRHRMVSLRNGSGAAMRLSSSPYRKLKHVWCETCVIGCFGQFLPTGIASSMQSGT